VSSSSGNSNGRMFLHSIQEDVMAKVTIIIVGGIFAIANSCSQRSHGSHHSNCHSEMEDCNNQIEIDAKEYVFVK